MMYFCCDELRRTAVKADANLNGIDYVEVLDEPSQPIEDRQRTLFVHFLKPLSPAQLTANNVVVEGGERIRAITVESTTIGADGVLEVEVDRAGDFSIYTLCLVTGPSNSDPPAGMDPMTASVDFTFKAECPSDFDCEPRRVCPPPPRAVPDIDYLAKDYASFRRLMLDRMASTAPGWRERHAADQGNMLVELLAYAADHLSYWQDGIATEAYLDTARRRISLRRHARLVDYFMHDGSNARAFVQLLASGDNVVVDRLITVNAESTTTKLLTHAADVPSGVMEPGSRAHRKAMESQPVVFELMSDATLFAAHNEIKLYTWGDRECCLPRGATHAYLKDDPQTRLRLRTGDVVVLEEVVGPRTGDAGDADPRHRHAVRLIEVTPEAVLENDGVSRQPGPLLEDPLTSQAYVEIRWDRLDALPFPVCVSAITDESHGAQYVDDVSVVRGNIVPADHGVTVNGETLGIVPEPELFHPASGANCDAPAREPVFPRFRPSLDARPLTHAALLDVEASAADAMAWSMRDVEPQMHLDSVLNMDIKRWTPRRDLLHSHQADLHFVVEIERDGTPHLRFGDDHHGSRPEPQTEFTADYRVGNGSAGNVAADSLVHIITNQPGIVGVRNPLPARGGVEPESMEDVRQNAPVAFRRQERAVTQDDYAEVVERAQDVHKAAATFRWTGSWHTVFITADRDGGLDNDSAFESRTRAFVERFRMAGHDLEVDGPRFVPLKLEMSVCVRKGYFRSDVHRALLEVFHSTSLPDGRRGLFHPDQWTFGQTVYLSPLYEAAQSIAGVDSVVITAFERLYAPSAEPLDTGKLELGRLEIARLDNDPSFPEHGVLFFEMRGGQ